MDESLGSHERGLVACLCNPAQPCVRYGFVIFRDVLSDAECTRTRDEIWNYLEDSVQLWLKLCIRAYQVCIGMS